MALVIENLRPLGGGGSGKAGDHRDLAYAADGAVSAGEAVALDEVLVALGVVEAADDRPHRFHLRVDALGD